DREQPLGPETRKGLSLLLKAYDRARDLKRKVAEFALPIQDLKESGLTDPDLRWLVHKGYLTKIEERTRRKGTQRTTAPRGRLRFTKNSCFALTATGAAYARTACAAGSGQPPVSEGQPSGPGQPTPSATTPYWDRRRTLYLGSVIVKQFKGPAKNQKAILDTFQ